MKKVSKNIYFILICTGFCLQSAWAQVVPFTSDQWVFDAKNATVEAFQGQQSLRLESGIAYLKDLDFQNGIIEFDIFLQEIRSFSGVIFRVENNENYEELYLRSHLSGKPDAMQYTPVNNGNSAWQLYHDQGSPASTDLNDWKMEQLGGFNTPYVFPFEQWLHVKLVVAGTEAELYLHHEKEPTLHINELKRGKVIGSIGLESIAAPAHFANFSYTKMDQVSLLKTAPAPPAADPNVIPQWLISDAFSEKELENQASLPAAFLKNRKWDTLQTERSGLANISTLRARTPEKNTVLAKVELQATKEQLQKLELGFSDRVRVYCNGTILYSGNNTYKLQDYRHLGTIGFYNTLYLPLKKGKNEIIVAVAETFGGWGIQGRLDNKEAFISNLK